MDGLDQERHAAVLRLKSILFHYFTKRDLDEISPWINAKQFRQYVWIMRDLLLSPQIAGRFFSQHLLQVMLQHELNDNHIEYIIRCFFAQVLYILYTANYFTAENSNAKERGISSIFTITISTLHDIIEDPESALRWAVGNEAKIVKHLSKQPVFDAVLRRYLYQNLQIYKNHMFPQVVRQMARAKGLPPNVPDEIISHGIQRPVDFFQMGIEPSYLRDFLDHLLG